MVGSLACSQDRRRRSRQPVFSAEGVKWNFSKYLDLRPWQAWRNSDSSMAMPRRMGAIFGVVLRLPLHQRPPKHNPDDLSSK